MLELIQELVQFLSRDRLSVEDVIDRVGSVVHDPGAPMSVELRPLLAGVRAASLGRYPDSGLPYLLTIELAPGTALTPAALRTAFGDYKRVRTDRGQPPSIIFYRPTPASRWKVALIAELQSATDALDEQLVARVSLRRDPVGS